MELFGVPLAALPSQLLLGLVNGSFYAILSLGLAIIFGLLNVINFAHGAMFMLGAMLTWMGLEYVGAPYWVMIFLAPAIVGVLGIVIIGKSLAALAITTTFKLDRATSLTVAASLAQIGEFSFILAAISVSLGAMSRETHDLILASALLSISLNPFVFALIDRIGGRVPPAAKKVEVEPKAALAEVM